MQVRVDWSPPNEFLASLATAVTPVLARHGEMGPAWAARARKVLTPVQAAAATPLPRIQPLVAKSGCRTVPAFMEYLGNLQPEEWRRARLEGDPRPWLDALQAWQDGYFAHVDSDLLRALAEEAASATLRLATGADPDVIEELTAGCCIEAHPDLRQVILVPQYHARPWNLSIFDAGSLTIAYPADVLPPKAGEPPLALLRSARALGDPSRLRILRLLGAGEMTFTEIAKRSRLAKSTVNHHLVALRAAGLVRVHMRLDEPDRYSQRDGAIEGIVAATRAYLQA